MSNTLTIIARIESKKDHLVLVKSEVSKLIEPTLKEEGCIQYDLHQDSEDSKVFVFVEKWSSKELWEVHMQSKHLAEFVNATDGALESLVINQMYKISS